MIDPQHLQTHIYAVVRDKGGSVMTICERIEFCVGQECVAVFEPCWLDFHYLKKGALFHVFSGRKLIKTAGTQITFSQHERLEDRIDRFALSSYDCCHLLKTMFLNSQRYDEWQLVSIEQQYADWLGGRIPFDPFLLAYLCSDQAERVVYTNASSLNPTWSHVDA